MMLGGLLPAAAQKSAEPSASTGAELTYNQTTQPSSGSQQTSDQPKNCDPAQQACDEPSRRARLAIGSKRAAVRSRLSRRRISRSPRDHGCERPRPREAGMDHRERDCGGDCDRRSDCGPREGPCELRTDEARRGCCEARPESCCEPRREAMLRGALRRALSVAATASRSDGGPEWKPDVAGETLTVSESCPLRSSAVSVSASAAGMSRGDLGVRSLGEKSFGVPAEDRQG